MEGSSPVSPERRLTAIPVALLSLVLLLTAFPAHAQLMSARRLAMGGVTLGHGGPGGDAVNVAYRAVPAATEHGPRSFLLPLGLIPVLQDPPTFDTNDPAFNAFEIANLALHPPWNLQLVKPTEPAGDVTLSVGRNALTIDLGSVRDVVPDERVRFAAAMRSPGIVIGVRRLFVGVTPFVQVQNDFDLNDALRGALHDGATFLPNTEYALRDRGQAQAAAQGLLGAAFPLVRSGAPEDRGGFYVGARARLLRGLAYGDADAQAGFVTPDTLFGNVPMDVRFRGHQRTAQPAGGGWGHGFDAGAVFVVGALELGLAANDLGTTIDWKVTETATNKDSASGDYRTVTIGEDLPFTSTVPANYVLTAMTRVGGLLLAADMQRDALEQVSGHAGAEVWAGPLALRAGAALDAQQRTQFAGGVGLRLGRFGLDVAVATNQANITHERAVDLGAGLSFYPAGSR